MRPLSAWRTARSTAIAGAGRPRLVALLARRAGAPRRRGRGSAGDRVGRRRPDARVRARLRAGRRRPARRLVAGARVPARARRRVRPRRGRGDRPDDAGPSLRDGHGDVGGEPRADRGDSPGERADRRPARALRRRGGPSGRERPRGRRDGVLDPLDRGRGDARRASPPPPPRDERRPGDPRHPRRRRAPRAPVAQPRRHAARGRVASPPEGHTVRGHGASGALPPLRRATTTTATGTRSRSRRRGSRSSTSTTAGTRRSCTTCTRWARAGRGSSCRPTWTRGSRTWTRRSSPPRTRSAPTSPRASPPTARQASSRGALFDAWTPGRAYPHTHGGVRLLSETASARLASPIEVMPGEIGSGEMDLRRASASLPRPWPGGTWRLRDIVETQLRASLAVLARRRRTPPPLAAHGARGEPPGVRAPRAVRVRRAGGRARRHRRAPARRRPAHGGGRGRARDGLAFAAAGKSYPAGSLVVPMQQPASGFAKTVLERQRYPDRRDARGAPARPYDVTAHTLPLLLGVGVDAVETPFAATLEPVEAATAVAAGRVEGEGPRYALSHTTGDLVAVGRLLAAGVPVRWATRAFVDGGRSFAPGAFLVPASARPALDAVVRDLGLVALAVRADPHARASARAARGPLPLVGPFDGRGLDALRVREAARPAVPGAARPRGACRPPAPALRRDRAARPVGRRDP